MTVRMPATPLPSGSSLPAHMLLRQLVNESRIPIHSDVEPGRNGSNNSEKDRINQLSSGINLASETACKDLFCGLTEASFPSTTHVCLLSGPEGRSKSERSARARGRAWSLNVYRRSAHRTMDDQCRHTRIGF